MKVGFTGTRNLRPDDRMLIDSVLVDLVEHCNATEFITGGCLGVDGYIVRFGIESWGNAVNQVIIAPANHKLVDEKALELAHSVIQMRKGTSYRDRNEKIVKEAYIMMAFWDGKTVRSGTLMTMNIAKREGKLARVVFLHR